MKKRIVTLLLVAVACLPCSPIAFADPEMPEDQNSSELALLYFTFFDAGVPSEEAIALAKAALGVEEESIECVVYPARVIYCDSQGEPRRWTGWIARNCWDNTLEPCYTLSCQNPTPHQWLTIAITGSCNGPPNGCGWIRAWGPPLPVDCDDHILYCSCISETQCSDMEPICCSSPVYACPDCPDCTP